MNRKQAFWALTLITIIGIILKPFFWRYELLGSFSNYQSILGMMAERYLVNGFTNLFYPEIYSIINGKPAFTLIYFPLVSFFAALGKLVLGGSLEIWGRFVSSMGGVGTALLIYRILRHFKASRIIGLAAVFFFTFSPYIWVYGRNFQNESLALLFFTLSFFLLCRFSKNGSKFSFLFSALSLGLVVVLRLHFVFLAPVIFFWLPKDKRLLNFILFGMLSALLPILWHGHAWFAQQQFNNIHTTLFYQLQVGKTFPNPLLVDPKFYVMMLRDLVFWVAGPLAFVLVLVGLLNKKRILKWGGMIVLTILFALLVPKKFVDHHFYFYPLVLPFSALAGYGFSWLINRFRWPLVTLMLIASVLVSVRVSWGPGFERTEDDWSLLNASKFIKQNVDSDDWIVASSFGSAVLPFYSRPGWTFRINPHHKKEYNDYMVIKGMNGITEEEWQKRNDAYENSIDYLEYLKEKGAKYFFTSTRKDMEKNELFLNYMNKNYEKITSDNDSFYGYKL